MKTNFKIRFALLLVALFAFTCLQSQSTTISTEPSPPDNALDASNGDEADAAEDYECLDLEIIWLAEYDRWGVFVRPNDDFEPPAYTIAYSGRVTIVAPLGFTYTQLTSNAGGKWSPGAVYFNPPEAPGRQFMTFDLKPSTNQLNLDFLDSTMLFSFVKSGNCPDSLYLMNDYVPYPLLPNEFTGKGFGFGFGPDADFQTCKTINRESWNCNPPPDQAAGKSAPASYRTVKNNEWFIYSPNPTRDWLNVTFQKDMEQEKADLKVLNLQGQLVRQVRTADNGSLRLQLDNLTPGLYFLVLESRGKVLQREKFVKQ